MNIKTSKGAAALLLAGIASAWPALAEEVRGAGLGNSSTAIDTFALYCPSTTSKAKARVWDMPPDKPRPRMRVKLIKCTVSACTSIKVDNRPSYLRGEGGGSSPRAQRAGGVGTYTVIIYKTAASRETYDVEATCHSNGTLITRGVTLKKCQDEAPGRGDRC